MSSSLLMTRRFAPLFWTQFFSAFSDNFLKNSLVFLILFHIGGSQGEALITFAAAVFIAPYFFLSALGGQLADRYDKAVVARRLKLAEIGVALIAVAGFSLRSIYILFIALFLFGVIASLVKLLDATPHPSKQGAKLADHTHILVFSDFCRTPQINLAGGRDHYPNNSALVISPRFRRGRTFGRTDIEQLLPAGDRPYTPPDLLATFLHAFGIEPRRYLRDGDVMPELLA